MKHSFALAALVALVGATQVHGQAVIYNFSDNTSDGWAAAGFSGSPAATVATIGGNNYIFGAVGSFQVLNVATGDPTSALYQAMQAAAANPNGYNISYNWYVDTSTFGTTPPTFLQLGTYVNTGSGYYNQNYGSSQVQLDGTQCASGQVFSGTVTVNMGAIGFDMPPADTFFRLGMIVNGNNPGSSIGAYFTDISVSPVPEPASASLFGLAAAGFWVIRRRRSTRR